VASVRLEDLTADTLEVAKRFLEAAESQGLRTKVISTLRTCEEQTRIYAQGRTEPGAVISGASGCRSWHVWGRAFDVLVLDENGSAVTDGSDPRYDRLGEIGRDFGLIWGGHFSWGRDAVHFEYHPGLSMNDLCPDRSNDVNICQKQIDHYNANAAYPPGIVSVKIVGGQESDFSVAKIVASAFVGAIAYHFANKLIKQSRL